MVWSKSSQNYNMFCTVNENQNSSHENSDLHASNNPRPISTLSRGVQITEFAECTENPTPLFLDESDLLIEQYLSPGKLQLLTGVDDLEEVKRLDLKVDTSETSLGNFGSLLPSLVELKLSGSNISNIRDLGSCLRKLCVLWLSRCGLEELDGISSMLNLKELYLEYNEISDLSPLSMLEELEILDLEGNNIDDINQVQYISLCPKLRRLALDGNPICVCPFPSSDKEDYDYRKSVKDILPNLKVLDDENIQDGLSTFVKQNDFDEDWAYIEELQRDALLLTDVSDEAPTTPLDSDRPTTAALRPASNFRPGSALRPSSGFRPLSASRRPQTMSAGGRRSPRPDVVTNNRPISSDAIDAFQVSSELTIGGVLCGNPSKALRHRRKAEDPKQSINKGLSKLLKQTNGSLKMSVNNKEEATEEEPIELGSEMNRLIEELKSFKVEHEKRMEIIKKSKEPQVLVVDHMEQAESSDDEDDFCDPNFEHVIDRHCADLRLKNKVTSDRQQPKESRKTTEDDKNITLLENNCKGFRFDEAVNDDEDVRIIDSPVVRSKSKSENRDRDEKSNVSKTKPPSELGPLRVPPHTPAQLMNTVRPRTGDVTQPAVKSKKLKVGPTGLPVSSQPVIRSLSGGSTTSNLPFAANTRPNLSLLPSKISRNVKESSQLNMKPPT